MEGKRVVILQKGHFLKILSCIFPFWVSMMAHLKPRGNKDSRDYGANKGKEVRQMAKESIPKEGFLPIGVTKDVVRHLSLGLYRNFALAVKELISNSYDAGATEVKIRLDLKNKRIVIRDNGKGMNFDELKGEFLNIGNYKQPENSPDKLGRMRIGTFGIGFLAPLPYCKVMKVVTKHRDGNDQLEAEINAESFFKEGSWNIQEVRVPYQIKKSDLSDVEGETIIVLEDIKPQIAEDLRRSVSRSKSKIDQFSGFEKFKWSLCQFTPIEFPPERKDLRKFFEDRKRVPMRLWLDADELFRNVPRDAQILEKDEKNFKNVFIKYAIMTPYDTVKPEEARGLQVRLRDVAIGFPRDFDVTKLGRVLGKLNFICGEVHIIRGLDSSLMVTRDSFNYTEEVAEIYQFFRDRLTYWNELLYRQAAEDKEIYESIPGEIEKQVSENLKDANLLRFAKERLRLTKSSITKRKAETASLPFERLKKALEKKKDYNIVINNKRISAKELPIKAIPKSKSVVIYEKHPAFVETIEIGHDNFQVAYEDWDYKNTPFAICKIQKKHNTVVFNNSHPLFKTKISGQIIKKLSLGVLLIFQNRKDKEELVSRFTSLLEEVLIGQTSK